MGRNVRYCPACAEQQRKQNIHSTYQQPTQRLYARLDGRKFEGVGWLVLNLWLA